eukprot:6467348-Amphidinium_carterae.1
MVVPSGFRFNNEIRSQENSLKIVGLLIEFPEWLKTRDQDLGGSAPGGSNSAKLPGWQLGRRKGRNHSRQHAWCRMAQ